MRVRCCASKPATCPRKSKALLASGNRDTETRAHLSEAANTLDEALKAPMTRQGV